MKKILIIIFFFLSLTGFSTTYYVSTSGSNGNNGTSSGTPWQTLAYTSGKYSAGDIILLKRGDTWYETLTVSASGSSGNRITFGAYGTGDNPVVSGFTVVTGWTNAGGGIYSKSISTSSTPNMVTVNGHNTPIGRWPDMSETTGWPSDTYTPSSFSSTQITDSRIPLPTTVDLDDSGAEVVFRGSQWVNERELITNHVDHTITYGATSYHEFGTGTGYFLQNHPYFLTRYSEWCYTSGTFRMYFGGVDPTTKTVKVASRDNAVVLSSRSYVTLENITFEGGNQASVYVSNSSNVTITDCIVRFSGYQGISGNNADYLMVNECTVSHSNNVGVYPSGGSLNATIQWSTIDHSGYINGMGGSNDADYSGIICEDDAAAGNLHLITHNKILSSGYDGIRWGEPIEISYNYIDSVCLNKSDGGGMYAFQRNGDVTKTIKYNIVLNSMSVDYGGGDDNSSHGIYHDGSFNVDVQNNIVANCGGAGLFNNGGSDNTWTDNIGFNCLRSFWIMSNPPIGEPVENIVVTGNTIVSTDIPNGKFAWWLVTKGAESYLSGFGTIDYNHYASPRGLDNYIGSSYNAWGGPWNYDNLTDWKARYGYDTHSTAGTITASVANQHLVYNDTTVAKTWSISGTLYDVEDVAYTDEEIVLQPFTGLVLIGTGTVTEEDIEPAPDPDPLPTSIKDINYNGARLMYKGKVLIIERR